MGTGHILPGAAETDMGLHDDQGRFPGFFLGRFDGFGQGFHIFGRSHPEHLPAISLEPGAYIFPEGDVRAAFDGDLIVIIEENQFPQTQSACQRSGFRCHPFHLVPVGSDAVGIVIHHLVAFFIVAGRQHLFGHSQPHRHGKAVAQRTG